MQMLATFSQQSPGIFPEVSSTHGRVERRVAHRRAADMVGNAVPDVPSPPQQPSQISEYKTLVELYDFLRSAQDTEKRIGAKQVAAVHGYLRQYQQWFESRTKNDPRYITPGVVLSEMLENADLLEFAKFIRSRDKGDSPSTCIKSVGAVGTLAKVACEFGLISSVPKKPSIAAIKRIKPRTETDRRMKAVPVSIDEFRRLMDAADGAKWPQLGSVPPSEFWRCCMISHYLYGFRSQDWFACRDQTKQGLLWSSILEDPQCPLIDDLTNEHGWAWYLVHKTKGKDEDADRPSDVLIPLSKEMRRMIELFRGIDPVRVFPLTATHKSYDREFAAIRERAGLSDKERTDSKKAVIRLSLGQCKVASFRKGCAQMWTRAGFPEAASYLLHHSDGESRLAKMTRERYVQHEQVLRDIVPALESLPLW